MERKKYFSKINLNFALRLNYFPARVGSVPYRSVLMMALLLTISGCSSPRFASKRVDQTFSFGVIADCQYCQVVGTGIRKYSQSDTKLKACVAHFNTMDLTYAIHLGDFIDRDWESFDIVNPIYDELDMPHYHVLGNHDFSVTDERKDQVPKKLNLPSKYYHFRFGNWRFVVLDGNDVSFHAYAEDTESHNFARQYYEQHQIESPKWNGAIGKAQISWLKKVLDKACSKEEKVMLFCHFPIYPDNIHNLWNAEEIIAIIEAYPCVKAYMNGHNHEGNYGWKKEVHYLTLKGMVDTEQNSYAVVRVLKDSLKVMGFGREESKDLPLGKRHGN